MHVGVLFASQPTPRRICTRICCTRDLTRPDPLISSNWGGTVAKGLLQRAAESQILHDVAPSREYSFKTHYQPLQQSSFR